MLLIFSSCHPQETIGDQTINKGKLHITTDTLSDNNKKLNYSIEIRYPKVNNDSWDHLQKYAMGFFIKNKSEFTSFTEGFRRSKEKKLTGDYRIMYQDDNLLSMLLETTWTVDGSSKILHHSHAVNWNLKEGIPILGNDYFIKKNSSPLVLARARKKIPESCDVSIRSLDLDFTFCEEGIHLKKLFLPKPAECYGIETVLAWKEIKDLLTENGKKFLSIEG